MRLLYRTELPDHDPISVFDWHERSGALERLTPPWAKLEVLDHSGGIRDGGRITLRVRGAPTSFTWKLRHGEYQHGRHFRDEQVSGPMKSWVHNHRFFPNGSGGTIAEDEIEVEPPFGSVGAALGSRFLKQELGRLFRFRYRRLLTDLSRHQGQSDQPRLTVAITGGSGLVGQALTHFLTTGGHRVIQLVRDKRRVSNDAVYWNPVTQDIDTDRLAMADAVVHLAGTSIAGGRWTDDRKRSIRESRVKGTELIAQTMAQLSGGPHTLISASAVGYYGRKGEELLEEDAAPGSGFLTEVCQAWEDAAKPAERAGVRVVLLRTGLALSPAGGALRQMLLPFNMGLGGRLGSGKQYMSWIDLDDLIGLIHHVLFSDTLSGPVNATAPNPVTNSTFSAALGRVLGRPTLVPVPSLAVKAVFGQLGTEALLSGQRVVPRKAIDSGFHFFYESIEESLQFQLGCE